jgi:hypothetical protein
LIADVDGRLGQTDLVFHLTHGLDDAKRDERINPRRYGERTWLDHVRGKFAMFTRAEAAAIVEYLKFKADADPLDREDIDVALRNFWNERLADQDKDASCFTPNIQSYESAASN